MVAVDVLLFLGFLDGMSVFAFFAECKICFCGVNSTFLSFLFWSYFGKAFVQVHVSW